MRYSIESSGEAIILRVHPDEWAPGPEQREIPEELAARYVDLEKLVTCWHWVYFSPQRQVLAYRELQELLASDPDPAIDYYPTAYQHLHT